MLVKGILKNKSVVDFLVMFLSNIIKKIIGFFREIILAYVFGSSIVYANFILLKTVTDLFSQVPLGSALQASLLGKFSKIYASTKEKVSLSAVSSSSFELSWKLFLLSQLVQLPIVWYLQTDHLFLYILLSFALGFILSLNFFASVFMLIMQARGEFKKQAFVSTVDIFISALFLYPLSLLFGIVGIIISRSLGMLSILYKYIKPMLKENSGNPVVFGVKDFNISLMILGNFANIIMLISRFVAGMGDDNNITFFNYSVILLNTFLTAIIINLNTIVLRKLAIKKDVRLIFFSVGIALSLGLGLVFIVDVFGFDIVQFIFQRGAFTLEDTIKTTSYAKDLSISFVFIFIASSLFQPYFSLANKVIKRDSSIMASILVISIIFLAIFFHFSGYTARENSLIMIYTLSIISMFLALFSSYSYFNITKR